MKTLTFYCMNHKKCDSSDQPIKLLSLNLIYSIIYRTEHIEEACGANKALDA